MKTLLAALLSLILASTIFAAQRGIKKIDVQTSSGRSLHLYSQSHALVIGVSEYDAPSWTDLYTVNEDVRSVSEALEWHGFNVMKLMNPTAKDLRNRIEDFIGEYGYEPDIRLLIYFSGHGYTQVKGTRQFGYLVPSDAPDPKYDEKGFFKRSVKMTQIQAWAKQIESKHAIFLFDSCFSGTVLKSRGVSSVVPEDITYLTTNQ